MEYKNEWQHWAPIYRKYLNNNLSFFGIRKDAKILDLGCGCGLLMEEFKELGYNDVKGCDVSEDMLNMCQEKGLDVVFGDMRRLDFPDNKFDCVFAYCVLHHISEYEDALKEIRRILKKGGIFCIVEILPCFSRSVLDFITYKLPVTKSLRIRKKMLLEEKEFYDLWLKNYYHFLELLKKHFNVISYKKGFLMNYIKVSSKVGM